MHRTTFRIDEEVLAEAKALAARQHRSLNSVMEEALRRMIKSAQEAQDRPRVKLPTSGNPEDRGKIDLSPERIKEILLDQEVEHFLEVTADEARRHERPDLRDQA
jgi:Ribbon-helix-helix protein, copG family